MCWLGLWPAGGKDFATQLLKLLLPDKLTCRMPHAHANYSKCPDLCSCQALPDSRAKGPVAVAVGRPVRRLLFRDFYDRDMIGVARREGLFCARPQYAKLCGMVSCTVQDLLS